MKKGKFKGNFLFIIGISVIVIILFIVGFTTFYQDSSLVFSSDGYIINATENSSDSYSFASGTKYKTNLANDIAFEDTENKSVSVDSASFVHYNDGSLSFLQNGALLDLDKVNEDYVPYYNISNKFMINYDEGKYNITNNTKSLDFTNWIGRISDDKYIVVGENLGLKIPGVNKTIEGDYFELLFMTDGVVKIDNQDVSYQVTAQGTTVYVGDNVRIDLGEGQIFYNNDSRMLLSQITISGDENIDIDEGAGGSGGGGGGSGDGHGDGSGVSSGVSSGVTSGITSGVTSGITSGLTSGTGTGSGEGEGGAGGAGGAGGGSGEGEGDGTGSGEGGGSGSGGTGEVENATTSATIELIKLDVTSTSMYATLQMNRSSLISGSLSAYLTNISTGERVTVSINKKDGTLAICSSGTDCYSFGTSLTPDNQYLLSIVDVNNSKQYFQKLITTSELGVSLEKMYTTSNSLTYNVEYTTNTNVDQVDLYLYDADGNEVFKQVGISETTEVVISDLASYSSYSAVIKNVSVCNENGNCSFDSKYQFSRTDMTLKKTPVVESIDVKKNVDSASFDLSATVTDEHNTVTKYIYIICEELTLDEEEAGVEPECFSREKTDTDALSIKVGTDVYSGVSYIYTFKVQYNDGQMEREVSSNLSKKFSMESQPYFQLSDEEVTSNSITGKLVLIDPNCTVPINGRVCRGKPEMNASNNFTLRYYKLVDGEEKKVDIPLERGNFTLGDDGNYYYNLNLTNLASETKYVIKVYGTYYLNGQEFVNSQIGDELYAETASTGNLKFVYTANDSSDESVISYYAKLSGGSTEEGGEESAEESLSALNSIETLTFDLYAGTYADDSESNNRHIGERITITGNSNIRSYFCSADPSSTTCNVSNNASNQFTNTRFGLESLSALMKATGDLHNVCEAKSFGCLATAYTVVVKGYDEAGNAINIDNNTYTYKITPSYYVDKQLFYNDVKNSILVTPILKEEFKIVDEETGDITYDFEEKILERVEEELVDKDTYIENLGLIDDETPVGLKLSSMIPQAYINAAYDYDKVVIKYYICDVDGETCDSETAIKTYSYDTVNYSDYNYDFYLNDSDFVRGRQYKVMYELEFTSSDGIDVYYNEDYTSIIVTLERQAPIYNFYILKSTKNTITYRYNIKDVDGAIEEDDYYFYYTVGGSKNPVKGDAYDLDATRQVTFTICEDSCNNTEYSVGLKQRLIGDTGSYVPMDESIFEGEYLPSAEDGNNEKDEFELYTFETDNRLYIKLNDDELGSRTALYRVILKDADSKEIYDRYYIASKLDSCSTEVSEEEETEVSIVCEKKSGDYKYITVDFKEIASYIGQDISVSVESYYDNGLVGITQSFPNGLLLQNAVIEKGNYITKYLNYYYSSKLDTSTGADVIYKVSGGSWGIGTGEGIKLYNILDLTKTSSYNNNYGAILYNGPADSVSTTFPLYPITKGVGIQFDTYANYNPKVVNVSTLTALNNNNEFKFDSIIPKVGVSPSPGINSVAVDFTLDGVNEDVLNSQFRADNGKYYLYVTLYDVNGTAVSSEYTNVKAEIVVNNGVATATVKFTDLNIKTEYKYKVFAAMKSSNDLVQVYDNDKKYADSYVKTTYATATLSESELLTKLYFKAEAIGYQTSGDSISNKQIGYNANVKNGAYMKVRFALYDESGSLLKFDGTTCKSGQEETECYRDIADASHSIDASRAEALKYIFNNNTFVFGDKYYKLKVFAIPYYSDGGYDISKALTLYDDYLVKSDGKIEIDVHELEPASFNVGSDGLTSGYDDKKGYYISLVVGSISDPDYVMKNGEYHIALYDNSGNIEYTVKNQNGKTVMIESGSSTVTTLGDAFLYSNSLSDVAIEFTGLDKNTQYSIELSYDTYRNNVSFIGDEAKKTAVSPYTDYIYTPISEGITLGQVVVSKESNTSFKLNFIGSNNISGIKKIKYKVSLQGSSKIVNGEVKGDSLFDGSGSNYNIVFDFKNGTDNTGFNFEASGNYVVTIHYYTSETSNEPIHTSTASILV